mgnify:CR=1 FL=1
MRFRKSWFSFHSLPISTVAIRALVPGELVKIHFRQGQDVRKGDLLDRKSVV